MTIDRSFPTLYTRLFQDYTSARVERSQPSRGRVLEQELFVVLSAVSLFALVRLLVCPVLVFHSRILGILFHIAFSMHVFNESTAKMNLLSK